MKNLMIVLTACLCVFLSPYTFADPININTASAEQLATTLKGVGQSKAEAIVRYRETHGDFATIDDLAMVSGIGLRTVDLNRENILVDAERKR